ncbi:MAG: hypothetical protein GYA24_10220 [Candidatus Lokiarchaeota archaeon]|nr:hypothetical protein [Candidatus Lokiarchaeota archaeon]
MIDSHEPIPFTGSRSDRRAKARQRRRVARARLDVAKDILAMLERGEGEKKER